MEGDRFRLWLLYIMGISIHSLRMEGDRYFSSGRRDRRYFNPLPPHGGRLLILWRASVGKSFQSTPSAWRETFRNSTIPTLHHISIHSLRMEGDRRFSAGRCASVIFQSTPSAWRETWVKKFNDSGEFISIHSLRMEGDVEWEQVNSVQNHFNPLPPHGGRLS